MAGRPAGSTRAVDQRRRRLARAPHPGAARLLHDPPAARQSLDGRHIAIVGDVKHSRVARSDVLAFTALGAEVTLVAPPTLLPPSLDGWPVEVSHDLDAVLPEVDVVYLLRMQRERMTEALLPSLREYTAALRPHRAAGPGCSADDAIVMHPGPMNRGVEIAAEVADLPAAVDHRPGAQRRRRAHGGAVPAARRRAPTLRTSRPARRSAAWLTRVRDRGRPGRRRRPASGAADVRRRRRARSSPSAPTSTADAGSLDAGGCVVAPGPRRPPHPPARAGPGGGRDRRDRQPRAPRSAGSPRSSPCPTPSRPSTRAAVVREVLDLGAHARCATSARPAAITVGRAGEQLAPMAEMAASACGSSPTTARGVQDDRLMRRALEYASAPRRDARPALRGRGAPGGGHMHEGEWSSRLGIPGQPAEAEELMVIRDIALARLTGARVHFQHLSTAGSVALVRAAKADGLPVTAEATPHHFTLTDAGCAGYDPVFKVNPPLRTDADVAAVQGRAGRRHHRRHRHRPRPAHPGGQGAAVRPGAARACSASRRRWPSPSPSSTCRSTQVLALLSWQPAAHRRPRRRPRRPGRRGPPGQPLRDRPDRHLDGRPRPLAPAAAATRPTPAARSPAGSATRSCAGEPVVIDGEAQR